MTQEELHKLIDLKLGLGMSYQEVYDELNTAIPGRELDLAGMIAELPSKTQRAEYGPWRDTMIAMVGAAIVAQAGMLYWLSTAFYFNPMVVVEAFYVAVLVFFLVLVMRWRSTGYKFLGYAALGMIGLDIVVLPLDGVNFLFWVRVGLYVVMAVMGIWLERKLGGKYSKQFLGHKEGSDGIRSTYLVRFLNR